VIARLDLRSALFVDATTFILQVACLATLGLIGRLSATTAYACVALATGVPGITWLAQSRRQFLVEAARIVSDAAHNWRLSRWLIAGQLVFLARGTTSLWLLAAFLNDSAAGTYAACETIILMANPLLLAFNNVLTPQMAKALPAGGKVEVRRLVAKWTALLVTATALLCGVFLFVGERLLSAFFGSTFIGHHWVIMVIAFSIIAEGLGLAAGSGLWVVDRPRINLLAIALGSITAIGLSAASIPWCGLVGAAFGSFVGRTVTSSILVFSFARVTRPIQAPEGS
jgi:O-antigen/teichoic acid export membrane protein